MKKILTSVLVTLLVLGLSVGAASAWFSGGIACSSCNEYAGVGIYGGTECYGMSSTAIAGDGFAGAIGMGSRKGGWMLSGAHGNEGVEGGQTLGVIASSGVYLAETFAEAGGNAELCQFEHVRVNPCGTTCASQEFSVVGSGDASAGMFATLVGEEEHAAGSYGVGVDYFYAEGNQGLYDPVCGGGPDVHGYFWSIIEY